ncbi:MAG: hypothetical protein M1835_007179 [Candelina submexicana]|nr:MAG: hypothetical protein M1835_007179 [Candelina submexicana]
MTSSTNSSSSRHVIHSCDILKIPIADSDSHKSSSVKIGTEPPKSMDISKYNYEPETEPKPMHQKASEDIEELQAHLALLSMDSDGEHDSGQSGRVEEVNMTPLFSASVKAATENGGRHQSSFRYLKQKVEFHQYGLLAGRLESFDCDDQDQNHSESGSEDRSEQSSCITQADPRIFLNVKTPFSAFICGSQGSGKSHTLSCMLEDCLLPSTQLGKLPSPLSGIVFHYDNFTSISCGQVCEAAYMCSKGIPVRVLVSPSNQWRMRDLYTNLPGLPPGCKKPDVQPLLLKEEHLTTTRMMNLMAVSGGDGPVPLYVEIIFKLLKEMAIESRGASGVNYSAFKTRLGKAGFSRDQNGPLNLRLELLESFMEPIATPSAPRPALKKGQPQHASKIKASLDSWAFEPGTLTIVDLSCPFVDRDAACVLFDICLSIFLEKREDVGRIVALDEAHKFMTTSAAATQFTDSLLHTIRLQRHLATRIVIATQEPTISPKLLDLSTMTFVHRFTSPSWLTTLEAHLAGASALSGDGEKRNIKKIFKTIVDLNVGEALLFSPSAMLDVANDNLENRHDEGRLVKLGTKYLKVRIRKRITADGGKSVMAI